MSFKSGFVTIIGKANVGKSTLLNALTGTKVAITSNRPQTTRNMIKAIRTDEDSQIVFLDTPGIYKANNKLGEFMVQTAKDSFDSVDIIVYLVDVSKKMNVERERYLISDLEKVKKPIIIGLNKVDEVENKDTLLPLIASFNEALKPVAIIPMSAKMNEGVSLLLDEIKGLLEAGPKFYPDDLYTDQPERFLAEEVIREKLFHKLSDEIPYGIAVEIISFKEQTNKPLIKIQANIYCEKKSHKAIVIGKKGSMLKAVGKDARYELERVFGIKIYLELWVKVKSEWRNDQRFLNSLGYKRDD